MRTMLAFAMAFGAIGAVACNTHPVQVQNQSSDAGDEREEQSPNPYTVEKLEETDTVVMPWSHVVEPEALDEATVEKTRIVFPGEAGNEVADSYRRLDIIVSEDPDHPFLRRIESIRREDGKTVVETRDANMTEAVFKGSYETGDGRSTGDDDSKRQSLSGNFAPLPENATFSFSSEEGGSAGISDPKMSASADPEFDVDPEMHLDMNIAPSNVTERPDDWKYKGVRNCSSDSDCHQGETCYEGTCTFEPNSRDATPQVDPRPWDDDQHTCAQLTQILKRLRNDARCRRRMETFWKSEGQQSRSNLECGVYAPNPVGDRRRIGSLKPLYLSQVEWAKKECRGALQAFEFHVRADIEAKLENVSISSSGSGWYGGSIADFSEIKAGPIFFTVGWLPVMVSLKWDPSVEWWVGASGSQTLNFQNPIGLKNPIRIGGGMHYYADDQRRRNGDFDRGLPTGRWHPNRAPSPSLDLYEPQVQGQSNISASIVETFQNNIDLLLYGTAGPFLQFRAPRVEFGYQGGMRRGPNGSGPNPQQCTLGAQLGARIGAGVFAQFPLCDECWSSNRKRGALKWEIASACGEGYCPHEDDTALCVKSCVTGDCGGQAGPESQCHDGRDNDGDGDVDCADSDCQTNSNESLCDGRDNDCDGKVDEGLDTATYFKDDDADGYGQSGDTTVACAKPDGYADQAGDCNDSRATVHPGTSETCNGVDDDCDGKVDENTGTQYCHDGDGDGHGDPNDVEQSCSKPTQYVQVCDDCDDSSSRVHPGKNEICGDNTDNDCDGTVDENCNTSTCYRDGDNDGYGTTNKTASCGTSGYVQQSGDCDDSDSSAHPGATETCDNTDNDCDGKVDEGVGTKCWTDQDNDGFGKPGSKVTICGNHSCSNYTGGHLVGNGDDCDDDKASTYPGAAEEDSKNKCMRDDDNDGYGDANPSTSGVYPGTDCDDLDPDIHPGATECCDRVDEDCDGDISEGYCTSLNCSTCVSGTCTDGSGNLCTRQSCGN